MELKDYYLYLHLRYSRGRCQKLILCKRSFFRERTGRRYGRGKRKIPDTENESEQHHNWALHTAVPKTLSSRHKRREGDLPPSVKEPRLRERPLACFGSVRNPSQPRSRDLVVIFTMSATKSNQSCSSHNYLLEDDT